MKTIHLLMGILILPIFSFGQDITDSLLVTFYNKTLSEYFSDTITYYEQKKFGCILLQTDYDTCKLIKNRGHNKFKFFNSETNKSTILSKPLKINKHRRIYCLSNQILGQDTVDIHLIYSMIEELEGDFNSTYAFSDINRYTPEARFIYNKKTNTWSYTSPAGEIEEILKVLPN